MPERKLSTNDAQTITDALQTLVDYLSDAYGVKANPLRPPHKAEPEEYHLGLLQDMPREV